MPLLTGSQIREFRDLLCEAFNLQELAQLVKFRLNETLETIVPLHGRSKQDVAFDLIDWFERHDRIRDLLTAVRDERPNVDRVRRFCEPLLTPAAAPDPNPVRADVANPDEPQEPRLGAGAAAVSSDSPAATSRDLDITRDRQRAERGELLQRLDQALANENAIRHPGCYFPLAALVIFAAVTFHDLWNGFFDGILRPVRGGLQPDSLQYLGIGARLLTTALLVAGLRWLLLLLARRFRVRALTALVRAFPEDVQRWGGSENLAHQPTLRKIIAAEEPTLLARLGPQAATASSADPVRLKKQLRQRELIQALEAHRSLLAERRRPAVLSYLGKLALAALLGFFGGSLSLFLLVPLLVGVFDQSGRFAIGLVFLPHLLIGVVAAVVLLRAVRARRRDAFADPMPTYRTLGQEYPEKVSGWGEACLRDLASVDAILTAEKAALAAI